MVLQLAGKRVKLSLAISSSVGQESIFGLCFRRGILLKPTSILFLNQWIRTFTKASRTRNSLKLWTVAWKWYEKSSKALLWFLIATYRSIGTTFLGGNCRFEPSCSAYALEAIKIHHTHKAFWLITKRVCKCRPGGPFGYDPVPESGVNLHATTTER